MRARPPSLVSLLVGLVLLPALFPGEAGKSQGSPHYGSLSSRDVSVLYLPRPLESLRSMLEGAHLFILAKHDLADQDSKTESLRYKTYLPLIRNDVDLTIAGLEATQAIQTATNSVPLVQNRPTILRIFARTTSLMGTRGITISVAATRNGIPLPGSPLMLGPYTLSRSPSRGIYTSTINVLLPPAWLSGVIVLTATVDASNVIRELNEANNTASMRLRFNYVPPLNIKFVPIHYTWSANGTLCSGPASESISYWLMHTYPIHAVQTSFRAPVYFTGDLSQGDTDWGRLLDLLWSIKQTDGAPESQVYYGLLDSHNGTCPLSWGGIGYIGWRVSLGQYHSYAILAHEIGHNFARLHAPCGTRADIDPDYPYPDGSIGDYGVDVFDGRVWTPGPPDNTKDVMSYCWPRWFSAYNYQALYEDQIVHGQSIGSNMRARVLLVRATVTDDEQISMQPVYSLEGIPTRGTESGDLTIELLDANGHVLVSQPAQFYEVADIDAHVRSLSVLVQSPNTPVAAVRIVKNGKVVAERQLDSTPIRAAAKPQLTFSAGRVTLSWGAPETPALVRYTVDGGQSWTTMGIDVRGGQLLIDSSQLPGGNGWFEIRLGDISVPVVLESSPLMLHDTPPSVQINGPTVLSFGQPLLLIGQATDREDGPITELRWILDGKEVEAGQTLQMMGLMPGEHTIVLTARDRLGQLGQAEHRVIVRDLDAADTSTAEQSQ